MLTYDGQSHELYCNCEEASSSYFIFPVDRQNKGRRNLILGSKLKCHWHLLFPPDIIREHLQSLQSIGQLLRSIKYNFEGGHRSKDDHFLQTNMFGVTENENIKEMNHTFLVCFTFNLNDLGSIYYYCISDLLLVINEKKKGFINFSIFLQY